MERDSTFVTLLITDIKMPKPMKKYLILYLIVLCASFQLVAQWNDSGSIISTNDNVHISNANAIISDVGEDRAALDLYDQDDLEFLRFYTSNSDGYIRLQGTSPGSLRFFPGNTESVTFNPNGYVGLGTQTPAQLLHLKSSNPYLRFEMDSDQFSMIEWFESSSRVAGIEWRGHVTPNRLSIRTGVGTGDPLERLVITETGNVGIGLSDPGNAKLAVAGKITSTEVVVEINPGHGPDYVFEEDYELRSLRDIKDYIQRNKHLPEIPSALEMEENGVELGEMNMLLLKKIEELTLHQIELLERLELQQKEIDVLKKKLD